MNSKAVQKTTLKHAPQIFNFSELKKKKIFLQLSYTMDENSNNVQVIFTFKLSNINLLKSSVSRLL